MVARGRRVEVGDADSPVSYFGPDDLSGSTKFLIERHLVFDFGGGGSRLDVEIRDHGVVIAKGEVKARKDTSNQWESWMPQVEDQLKLWKVESPDAARLHFGTLITKEMIEGVSQGGVPRTGLKNLVSSGLLTSAYNLTRCERWA